MLTRVWVGTIIATCCFGQERENQISTLEQKVERSQQSADDNDGTAAANDQTKGGPVLHKRHCTCCYPLSRRCCLSYSADTPWFWFWCVCVCLCVCSFWFCTARLVLSDPLAFDSRRTKILRLKSNPVVWYVAACVWSGLAPRWRSCRFAIPPFCCGAVLSC